jgi:hypothetical protein
MCPDYLTYVALPTTTFNNKTIKSGCIDMLGITPKKTASSLKFTSGSTANGLKSGTVPSSALNTFEFTSADVKAATSATDLQKICARCQQAGVTWEGVYDGDACVGVNTSANAKAAVEQCLLSI